MVRDVRAYLAVILVGIMAVLPAPVCGRCQKINNCSCESDDGIINLAALAKYGGEPRFKDAIGKEGKTYSWNPCIPFTESSSTASSTCKDVAVCEYWVQGVFAMYIGMGTQSSAEFVDISGDLSIKYTMTENQIIMTSYVTLTCKQDADSFVVGSQATINTVYLEYSGKSACPVKQSNGLSVGSILLILLCVLLVTYILAGVLYLYFAKQAVGRERCPNYNHWRRFPGLVKDGFMFVVKCGKSSTY